MANYFLDFEFIEGFEKPLFGKRRWFIEMISVGIISEQGAAYYAISRDFDYNKANQWVKDEVITPLYIDTIHGDERNRLYSGNFHKVYGKPNKLISQEIMEFVKDTGDSYNGFYGYYSDYDWVLLCSLFGTMMDLPEYFPMYCKDLKQTFDEKISASEIRSIGYERAVERLKQKTGYPKQQNEHNALSDAKWNRELYKWLKTV